jgi:hypothetical protein
MCVDSTFSDACVVSSYKFVQCISTNNHIPNTRADGLWQCKVHGRDCMGHLETDVTRSLTLLPSSLAPDINGMINRYQRYKDSVCMQRISHIHYKRMTSKIMMGKKGLIRSMNSIRKDGSMKMVISAGPDLRAGTVEIPSIIAQSIKVLRSEIIR